MQSSVWKDTSSQWQPCNFSPDSQCQTVLKRAEDAPELVRIDLDLSFLKKCGKRQIISFYKGGICLEIMS